MVAAGHVSPAFQVVNVNLFTSAIVGKVFVAVFDLSDLKYKTLACEVGYSHGHGHGHGYGYGCGYDDCCGVNVALC